MQLLIWGTGNAARELLGLLEGSGHEVAGLLDNDPSRWGEEWEGRRIVPLDELGAFRHLAVVVTSRAYARINRQLVRAGFDGERIYDFLSEPGVVLEWLGVDRVVVSRRHALVDGRLQVEERRLDLRPVVEDLPCPLPWDAQVEISRRVGEAFLAARAAGERSPPVYRVGENWAGVLQRVRGELHGAVESASWERAAALLGNYFRDDISSSMGGNRQAYRWFCEQRDDIRLRHNLDIWRYSTGGEADPAEAAMPPVGNPFGFAVDGVLVTGDSLLNHYRAWFARRLLRGLRRPVVAEIGGGYGGFAHFLLRGGECVYINFDIPENLLISSYFLSVLYPQRRVLLFDPSLGAVDAPLLERYDILLLPNFMLPALAGAAVDLFVNTISFSEMEYATIEEYLSQIGRSCRRFFYHENLAVAPPYKGFPVDLFPAVPGFRELSRGISRWAGFDAYATGHVYTEQLYLREEAREVAAGYG